MTIHPNCRAFQQSAINDWREAGMVQSDWPARAEELRESARFAAKSADILAFKFELARDPKRGRKMFLPKFTCC